MTLLIVDSTLVDEKSFALVESSSKVDDNGSASNVVEKSVSFVDFVENE